MRSKIHRTLELCSSKDVVQTDGYMETNQSEWMTNAMPEYKDLGGIMQSLIQNQPHHAVERKMQRRCMHRERNSTSKRPPKTMQAPAETIGKTKCHPNEPSMHTKIKASHCKPSQARTEPIFIILLLASLLLALPFLNLFLRRAVPSNIKSGLAAVSADQANFATIATG